MSTGLAFGTQMDDDSGISTPALLTHCSPKRVGSVSDACIFNYSSVELSILIGQKVLMVTLEVVQL